VITKKQIPGCSYSSIIIKSPDTDVAVIALALKHQLSCNLFFLTGVRSRTRLIDLQKIEKALTSSFCEALIGVHTLSGCDSTSACFGNGKKKVFELVRNSEEFTTCFKELRRDFTPNDDVFPVLKKFVGKLYGYNNVYSVNEA